MLALLLAKSPADLSSQTSPAQTVRGVGFIRRLWRMSLRIRFQREKASVSRLTKPRPHHMTSAAHGDTSRPFFLANRSSPRKQTVFFSESVSERVSEHRNVFRWILSLVRGRASERERMKRAAWRRFKPLANSQL